MGGMLWKGGGASSRGLLGVERWGRGGVFSGVWSRWCTFGQPGLCRVTLGSDMPQDKASQVLPWHDRDVVLWGGTFMGHGGTQGG